jgi:hypothetical protein
MFHAVGIYEHLETWVPNSSILFDKSSRFAELEGRVST